MRALVVAKAPVPGQVKTRLGAAIGMPAAARVAVAALLDTVTACSAAFEECYLAIDGSLDQAWGERALRESLRGWTVFPQRGSSLGERLAHAHAEAAGDGPTVQIGMDTPQVMPEHLWEAARLAGDGHPALGPSPDGGWWVLALRDPRAAQALAKVPMSRADTFTHTQTALARMAGRVHLTTSLRDVDTVEDAAAVAATLETGHFKSAWDEVCR
jgi:hypothetical protein